MTETEPVNKILLFLNQNKTKVPFTVDYGYFVDTGEQLQYLHSECVSEGENEFPTFQKLQCCYN